MVEHVARLLPRYLRPRWPSVRVAREVGAGRTIADVVVAASTSCEWPPLPTSLTITQSVVLSVLRTAGGTRRDILERYCGLTRDKLNEGAIAPLLEMRLVQLSPGGCVRLRSSWHRKIKLIAIEAKLLRWRDALEQAELYRGYADESYVVLPSSHAEKWRDMSAEFRRRGVGLFLVSNGDVRMVIAPARSAAHDWRREFVLSRVMSR